MVSEVKLCKDCRFSYRAYGELGSLYRCKKFKYSYRTGNYATGFTKHTRHYTCEMMRENNNECGHEAKHFEQRQSLWERIKLWLRK